MKITYAFSKEEIIKMLCTHLGINKDDTEISYVYNGTHKLDRIELSTERNLPPD